MIWQVLKDAREKFTQEISFQSKDKDISLAKVVIRLVKLFLFSAVDSLILIVNNFLVSRNRNE